MAKYKQNYIVMHNLHCRESESFAVTDIQLARIREYIESDEVKNSNDVYCRIGRDEPNIIPGAKKVPSRKKDPSKPETVGRRVDIDFESNRCHSCETDMPFAECQSGVMCRIRKLGGRGR